MLDNNFQRYLIPQKSSAINNEKIDVVGIDLGTSRCCAAVNRKHGIETVALDYKGERLLPSFVAYDEDKEKCGQLVIDRLRYFAKSTVFDSKRIIGITYEKIFPDRNWPFKVINAENKILVEIETENGILRKTPKQIATVLLKHVKQKAEAFQGQKLTKAVITVPASFTKAQEKATRSAAILAGFDDIELLPEPVAAAFAYFVDRPISNNSTVLLFDLGGGTLDVCIFKIINDQIEIISNDGDSQLGGRDFDNILSDYFKKILHSDYGITDLGNKKYKLMLECQKIKETLSTINDCWLDVEDLDPTKTGFIKINRDKFQSLAVEHLEKLRKILIATMNKTNYNSSQIDKVLQVGGGSRMPMIKNLLKDLFPQAEHCCEEHPDEVVAIGAAYYGCNIFSSIYVDKVAIINHDKTLHISSSMASFKPSSLDNDDESTAQIKRLQKKLEEIKIDRDATKEQLKNLQNQYNIVSDKCFCSTRNTLYQNSFPPYSTVKEGEESTTSTSIFKPATYGRPNPSLNFYNAFKNHVFGTPPATTYDPFPTKNANYEPVVPLPDKVDVVTESEGVLFKNRCKLYFVNSETKEVKERGIGDIYVLFDSRKKRYRVIMRREHVQKICANFFIKKGMNINDKIGTKCAGIFNCIDFAENPQEEKSTVFVVRFREEKFYEEFKKIFNDIAFLSENTELFT